MNGSFLWAFFKKIFKFFHSHALVFCVRFKPLFHRCQSFYTLSFSPITTLKVQGFFIFLFPVFFFALCKHFVLMFLLTTFFPFLLQFFLFGNSRCFFLHCYYFVTKCFHYCFVVLLLFCFYKKELTCFTIATKVFEISLFFPITVYKVEYLSIIFLLSICFLCSLHSLSSLLMFCEKQFSVMFCFRQ